MALGKDLLAKAPLRLPALGLAAAIAIAVPSAGLAVAGFGQGDVPLAGSAFDLFTPASVDPELAARVAAKARDRGLRFTPSGTGMTARSDRTVTVAVRIDDESAQAISIKPSTKSAPGLGTSLAGLDSSRFNLGTARGYQSFARPLIAPALDAATSRPGRARNTLTLPDSVRKLSVPDLADFAPSRPRGDDEPGRLQPRVELDDQRIAGRSPNTLDATASQTLDVGGSFRLSPNLDVTAGVRYSQERERLDPVANSVKDSQAVYVGTQIRF
ncbi:MAG: hypothetical protein WA936_14030 [Erythrobacter sp.]